MTRHPYVDIPDHARWDRGVAERAAGDVDPVVRFPIRLTPGQAIVTAGSCFAQHISRYLQDGGFNYVVTEPGHPVLDPKVARRCQYGLYSARYGNVYTSRQLEQLFRRAYGDFEPADVAWERPDRRLVDPFRPTVQPGGFIDHEELEADRRQHLDAVRRAFEQLDVLVFTLGLTECWAATGDGAVFPLAPGVAGGTYDPARYALLNLGVDDVVTDMTAFITGLRTVNPGAKVILTVSPVPLNATAIDRHVLVSTTYSKSVLRVAAEMLATSLEQVHYFPAYEIVTGGHTRGRYFEKDLRSVSGAGVERVMSLFFQHATTGRVEPTTEGSEPKAPTPADDLTRALEVLCDEELLTLD